MTRTLARQIDRIEAALGLSGGEAEDDAEVHFSPGTVDLLLAIDATHGRPPAESAALRVRLEGHRLQRRSVDDLEIIDQHVQRILATWGSSLPPLIGGEKGPADGGA